MTVEFKQGDLEPSLIIDLYGEGADLNDVVSWRLIGRMRGATALLIDHDETANVVVNPTDATKAVLTHTWTIPETATLGLLQLEVEAHWPGTPQRPQTFPRIQVRIADDLDP